MWFYLKLVFNYIFIHEKLQGCTSCKLNLHSKVEIYLISAFWRLTYLVLKYFLLTVHNFHSIVSFCNCFDFFLILMDGTRNHGKFGKEHISIYKMSTLRGSCHVPATFWFLFRLQNIQTALFTGQFLSKTSNYSWVLWMLCSIRTCN